MSQEMSRIDKTTDLKVIGLKLILAPMVIWMLPFSGTTTAGHIPRLNNSNSMDGSASWRRGLASRHFCSATSLPRNDGQFNVWRPIQSNPLKIPVWVNERSLGISILIVGGRAACGVHGCAKLNEVGTGRFRLIFSLLVNLRITCITSSSNY
ncbi:hypothetical protein K438DRAFT_1760872 [Mycena galopus ATCC 62051]|nr:hypothetical protein K438DRAFT_1760872 [Mycena galopus ATCC 62051]